MALRGAHGIAIFVGNNEAPMNYRDNQYKFRQDSSWLYFWGIDEPRFAAVMDLDEGTDTIYADDCDIDDIIWNGPSPTVSMRAAEAGVTRTGAWSDFIKEVEHAKGLGRDIHFLPASRYYNAGLLASLLSLDPSEVVSNGKKGCRKASEELVLSTIEMRLVKGDCEIEEIDKSCYLGYLMHTMARDGIRVGVVEQEIVGSMEGLALSRGWGVSFPTILTQHGEVFHCHSHECTIAPDKLLVIDAGVESNTHYASDFTRTYPTGGRFTGRQRDIYQIVCDCNEYAFSITRPGISYRDVHLAVAARMLEGLRDVGLVRGDTDDMVNEGIAGLFMPHGLGHNMGLDVHDMEDLGENLVGYGPGQTRSSQLGLGSLRMARTLVPGNIVTDEPGIYFIPDLIEQWKASGQGAEFVNFEKLKDYYGFGGIRLEDDVLITSDGARRLGADRLAIAPDDVEAAMAK